MSPHRQYLQPLLHDLTAAVHAPVSALSGHDGQVRGQGVQGVFYADCRVLSEAVLRVDGQEPEPVMRIFMWDILIKVTNFCGGRPGGRIIKGL